MCTWGKGMRKDADCEFLLFFLKEQRSEERIERTNMLIPLEFSRVEDFGSLFTYHSCFQTLSFVKLLRSKHLLYAHQIQSCAGPGKWCLFEVCPGPVCRLQHLTVVSVWASLQRLTLASLTLLNLSNFMHRETSNSLFCTISHYSSTAGPADEPSRKQSRELHRCFCSGVHRICTYVGAQVSEKNPSCRALILLGNGAIPVQSR